MSLSRISVALLLLLGSHQLCHAEAVALPDGYRLQHYRAPTPATLPGATVLDTAALQRLLATRQPLLLDVMATGQVTDADGVVHWLPVAPRRNLPGSVWLPNTGYGELEPAIAAYFQRELARLSGGKPDQPLVFYCLRDCWMSWNAARRALSLGYRNVFWYPAGSDGWAEAGLPLQDAAPQPL
ncbi:PQQ-dependent catabolism-associated CXXCW motif protein [Vogesella oryzae]|uniref:PQQ-dependent catabolism-associated CXXCW motif protein n=1 Tax=Vogesella oryzae TaxID=1735285 RepID=UPI0015823F81|nr:PQQ-dependent catabolism-associated CXXCW motif protein [Vogesella oryzae]